MSRGLGPAQLALLRYAGRLRGEPVAYVAEHLGVGERRGRKVVASLVVRGLALVADEPCLEPARRIWTPEARAAWVRRERDGAAVIEGLRLDNRPRFGVVCDACGHFVETSTFTRTRYAYRRRASTGPLSA
jgi:hypothetical protein